MSGFEPTAAAELRARIEKIAAALEDLPDDEVSESRRHVIGVALKLARDVLALDTPRHEWRSKFGALSFFHTTIEQWLGEEGV